MLVAPAALARGRSGQSSPRSRRSAAETEHTNLLLRALRKLRSDVGVRCRQLPRLCRQLLDLPLLLLQLALQLGHLPLLGLDADFQRVLLVLAPIHVSFRLDVQGGG